MDKATNNSQSSVTWSEAIGTARRLAGEKRLERASEFAELALQLAQDVNEKAFAINDLGVIRYRMSASTPSHVFSAEALFRSAAQFLSEGGGPSSLVLNNLGLSLLKQRRLSESESLFIQAVRGAPKDSPVRRHSCLLLSRLYRGLLTQPRPVNLQTDQRLRLLADALGCLSVGEALSEDVGDGPLACEWPTSRTVRKAD